MKKLLGLLLAMTMLFTGFALAEDTATGLTQDIVVLFTSDVHCGVNSGFGYAGLAAVRDTLAKSNHVLLVDNGDSIQGEPIGTMTTGESNIQLMNAVGYDIATMGNHEFDYRARGLAEMLNAAVESGDPVPPIVQANYKLPAEDADTFCRLVPYAAIRLSYKDI